MQTWITMTFSLGNKPDHSVISDWPQVLHSHSFIGYGGLLISSKVFYDPSHIQNATTTITTPKPNNQLLVDRGKIKPTTIIVGQEL